MKDIGKLLSPINVGRYKLKNRIVFGPHRTNYAIDHIPGERHRNYYEERAKNGAALIVIEGSAILPEDYGYEKQISIFVKGAFEAYRRIADSVHKHDCLVVAQLSHFGAQGDSSIIRKELWAPSPFTEVDSGEVPKEMEKADIELVATGFGKAAKECVMAGMDGIEINAGQFSLLRQFLSPLTNFRSDEYGGSLQNRAKLCLEVINNTRKEIGNEKLLGLRLCGDEFAPWGGLTPEDSAQIANYLCDSSHIDYLTIEVGSLYSVYMTAASMRVPEDYAVKAATQVADITKVPTCATGSIVSVDMAEKILQGNIELVEMTRALIADPELPAKVENNQTDSIRPCVLCNQGCYVYSVMNPELSCSINPDAGCERHRGKINEAVSKEQRVFIIGGGPAGLSAAVTAAKKGHIVVLYEKEEVPGGRLRLAAKISGNERFNKVIEYFYKRAKKLGVDFRFQSEANTDLVDTEKPDVIVFATGSRPPLYPFPIEKGGKVIYAEEAIAGKANVGQNVVIIDYEGAWLAVGAAQVAMETASSVHVVSPEMFISSQLAKNGEYVSWYQKAFQKGIKMMPQTEVIKVGDHFVEIMARFSREVSRLEGIDTVILAARPYPEFRLYKKLAHKGIEVWTVGDCVAPRNIGTAIREGQEIGMRI